MNLGQNQQFQNKMDSQGVVAPSMPESSTVIMPPTVQKELKHEENNNIKVMPYVQMGLQLSNSNVSLPGQN